MFPHERSLVKRLNGEKFALIGVNGKDPVSLVQKMAKDGTVTWRSFKDEQDGFNISDRWGVITWPGIFLINPDGTVHSIDPHLNAKGMPDEDTFEKNMVAFLDKNGVEYPHELIEEDVAKAKEASRKKREAAKAARDAAKAKEAATEKTEDDLDLRAPGDDQEL